MNSMAAQGSTSEPAQASWLLRIQNYLRSTGLGRRALRALRDEFPGTRLHAPGRERAEALRRMLESEPVTPTQQARMERMLDSVYLDASRSRSS